MSFLSPIALIAATASLLTMGLFCEMPTAAAGEILLESVKQAGQSQSRVQRYGLTRKDYQRIIHTLPVIRRAVAVRNMPGRAIHGERTLNVDVIGTSEDYEKLARLKISRGRFLSTKDVKSRNNVAVVDAKSVRVLFGTESPIGRNVRIGDNYFLIVGQVAGDQQGEAARIFIPLTAMQSRYGDLVMETKAGAIEFTGYELSQIHISLEPNTNVQDAMRVIRALLKKYHESADYSIRSLDSAFKQDG